MAIRGEGKAHHRLRDIQPRHWQRLAANCRPGVWERRKAMVDAVANELPAEFPERIWKPISAGMRRHAQLFQRAVEADAGN